MRAPENEPISVPAEPVAGAGSPFPVVASIAPVVASVVLWSLTRSPFVLVFAALGPIIAVAGVLDGRWSIRRRLRSDSVRYRAELERLAALIDERLDEERRFRRASSAGARVVLDAGNGDASGIRFGRWRVPAEHRFSVVVGSGDQPSSIRVDGATGTDAGALKRRAALVPDVPVLVDATGGIGVVGPAVLTRAFARGVLVQLGNAVPPDALALPEMPAGWEWAASLPHRRAVHGVAVAHVFEVSATSSPMPSAAASDVLLVLAEQPDRIPTRCAHVVEFTGIATALLHRTTNAHTDVTALTVDLVSEAEAGRFAADLAAHAHAAGLAARDALLPAAVGLTEASASAGPAPPSSLSAVIGSSGRSVVVDIVADGPHAIVGGTTGSGKSELLVTWITSLADRYPPSAVNFLLVDFKGGAAFFPLLPLPHVAGVVTDLDAASARRALESLRAEVRFRERCLRDVGARDIVEVPSLARLVIVVDEFAAMLDGYPDLHALFIDLAARGRSLGMHLILCTQRPAGVVRDSLLANCGLRMSLRVHSRADSTAILGTDAAAFLPATVPGRLALAAAAGTLLLQVASTSEPDLSRAVTRWPAAAVRRPWLDPLPGHVARESLAVEPDGIRLGLADHPAEQRQATAVWRPEADGNLLVVGTSRTGKTTLLDTIAAEASRLGTWIVERVGPDAELAWDVIHSLAGSLAARSRTSPGVLVLLDGLDSLLARIDPDDAAELRDGVLTLLRDGPRCSVRLVVTVQRLSGPSGAVAGFIGSTVLLGTANRQEHLLAGGDSADWTDARRAGSANWRGAAVQLCAPESAPAAARPRHAASRTAAPVEWHDCAVTLLVSSAPARRVAEIRAGNRADSSRAPVHVAALGDTNAGRITVEQVRRRRDGPVVIVGDADQWQAHWSLLTALRESARIVVDGCSQAEFRTVTRIRARPPLLDRVPGRAWSCEPTGEVRRVSLTPSPQAAAGGDTV